MRSSSGSFGLAQMAPREHKSQGTEATSVYLVTVRRLVKDPAHDPKNKKSGPCPVGSGFSGWCDDVTGEHHTFATLGYSAVRVRELWDERGKMGDESGRFRVTRVEEARWVSP